MHRTKNPHRISAKVMNRMSLLKPKNRSEKWRISQRMKTRELRSQKRENDEGVEDESQHAGCQRRVMKNRRRFHNY